MREIKFKGLAENTDTGKRAWHEYGIGTKPHFIGHYRWIVQDLQFTGRKDKNELEVYDNDVIRIISTISGEYDISKVDTIKQVIWRDEMVAYCLETKSERQHYEDGYNVYKYARSENRVTHMFLDQVENFEVEVIGNIYENPDLLP
jgi:uncharacterized phage protein (TIGR01671 family)